MENRGAIGYIALGLLASAGIVVALALAPGLGAALKLIDPNPRKASAKLDRALRALVQGGKVEKGPKGYRLTTRGERELARGRFDRYQLPPPKKWDKKWRVVCFDIPEKRKYVRHLIQRKLVELGFYRLQDSVFVGPQPCGEFLNLAQEVFFLRKHLRGMVVTQIDDEYILLRHFNLTR